MDKQRQKVVDEIRRLKTAIEKTRSEYLKRDYSKALKHLSKELRDYDRFKMEVSR